MLKKILIVLVILLIIIVIGNYYLDTIVKGMIEESGSRVLQTDVTVGSVSIDLLETKITIDQLDVANPPGYSDNSAFRFSEVTAVIHLGSGVFERIYTSQPEIRVEFKGDESNFDVLQRNIEASVPRADPEDTEEQMEKHREEAEEVPRIQIDEVVIEEAKATVTVDGNGEPFEVSMQRVEFVDLEGTPDEVARSALRQFVSQVVAAVALGMVEKKASEIIEEQGDKLKDKLKDLLN